MLIGVRGILLIRARAIWLIGVRGILHNMVSKISALHTKNIVRIKNICSPQEHAGFAKENLGFAKESVRFAKQNIGFTKGKRRFCQGKPKSCLGKHRCY